MALAASLPPSPVTGALLDIDDLVVEFTTRNGAVRAVDTISFQVRRGETIGVVGESGSGKSVTSYAVMKILDRAGRITHGTISFDGRDLTKASEPAMQTVRGSQISMIFQNPRASLNPIRTVGRQIADVLIRHDQASAATARERAIEALRLVRITKPEERVDAFPFQLSGGMCQRVVIAIALACRPKLLIADEPTTGLDVTTQKAVMDLVVELGRARDMATILITHDLGLAATYCDRLIIMERGRVVEAAASKQIFAAPEHPYSARLMKATPRAGIGLRDLLATAAPPVVSIPAGAPLLQIKNLAKHYGSFRAVDGISFDVKSGESVGLVGESGCGKSTTSMMVMRLLDPTAGSIVLDGRELATVPASRFAGDTDRGKLQMVFQDATESLNPRYTAFRAIADPLYRLGGVKRADAAREKVERLADLVGLPLYLLDRFPHQLSGGQKARVGIARAIALSPKLVILDEPTAALDVSVQAIVLNLLADLKATLGMSYLFVSHDL
ncbi:ABC transporter ATP-binding protein, partial [Beijerinckia sp. L45]|uniref:ATP-binding cassette domain-containing protein n=1 Tax=Beijerinckia sp. L45 TaxID=1641855 RepID=UPI001FEEC2F6